MPHRVLCLRPEADFTRVDAAAPNGLQVAYHAPADPQIAELMSAAEAVLDARAAAAANGFFGSGASDAGLGLAEAILTDESAAALEESLERRALITDAVRLVSARTGRSSEQALLGLLTQARERSLTLAEVSSEAIAGHGTG